MNKASPALITAAKQVFRYLKGTKYEGITFFKKDPLRARIPKTQVGKLRAEMFTDGLYAFSDSSDADDGRMVSVGFGLSFPTLANWCKQIPSLL